MFCLWVESIGIREKITICNNGIGEMSDSEQGGSEQRPGHHVGVDVRSDGNVRLKKSD